MADPQGVLEAAQRFLDTWEDEVPLRTAAGPAAWRRDGLGVLYNRLEALKISDAQVTDLLERAHVHLGRCRALAAGYEDEVTRAIGGPQFEGRVTMMSNRGMAADERAISHRMRAGVPWSWQRTFERLALELAEVVQALRALTFSIRDERQDIRAQIRGIQVGIEISEL